MPIIISPAQGLLLLIDKKKCNMLISSDIADEEELEDLIKLYILGAQTSEDYQNIVNLLYYNLSDEYEVSYTADTINSDPSRRYFETHLALWSLSDGLKKISYDDLYDHRSRLYDIMPIKWSETYIENQIKKIETQNIEALSLKDKIFNTNLIENSAKYFEKTDWNKMLLIFDCWISGVLNAQNVDLPFDIYDKGYFLEENRGRQIRNKKAPLTHNTGLLTSTMPSPPNDITRYPQTHDAETASSTSSMFKLKPGKEKLSDIRTFVPDKRWTTYHFSHLVHPFSNSISGTMLIQLRCLLSIHCNPHLSLCDPILEKNKLANYFRLFSSLLILHSGGHSWFEFLSPIFLPATKRAFSNICEEDNVVPEMDLEYVMYNENQHSINQALYATISYNRTLLINEAARTQIRTSVKLRSTTTTPLTTTTRDTSPTNTRESTPSFFSISSSNNQLPTLSNYGILCENPNQKQPTEEFELDLLQCIGR